MTLPKVVIFGAGDVAQLAAYYFERDAIAEVIGFCVDAAYLGGSTEFEGRPLHPFETIEAQFNPAHVSMFVALSYGNMNRLRAQKFAEAKRRGYKLLSYVSPDATVRSQHPVGENCFIFEDNTIQPFVRIGANVTLWSGNHIGHHSVIEDHNFVSSHVVISGHCHVSSYCFLGVNSTVAHQVKLAEGTLLGAGAVVTKDTEPNGVYVPARVVKLGKTSDMFEL